MFVVVVVFVFIVVMIDLVSWLFKIFKNIYYSFTTKTKKNNNNCN